MALVLPDLGVPVTEWKLFDGDTADFSALEFFRDHPWVPPENQAGHRERTAMAATLIGRAHDKYRPGTISELGCGDGSLLAWLRDLELPVKLWGYDAGRENVRVARSRGLEVSEADILTGTLIYGDLILLCEVLEHLADPHGFLRRLPGGLLVATSPSAETGDWHYEHHAWAWDKDGYRDLVTGGGWEIVEHEDCYGGETSHCGRLGHQRFQGILAVRP